MHSEKHKLGLIVNPLAGIGGRVGLKGSDGIETVRKALALGAEPQAPARACETLRLLAPSQDLLELVTYPAEMGADEARASGFTPTVLGSIVSGATTAADTRRAAADMIAEKVELLLFVGGDGTARDIYETVGERLPVLGIPAGVKVHSSVYAVNPRRASEAVEAFLKGSAPLRDMEVMDIDEDLFRAGRVSAKLHGYLKVPFQERLIQGAKSASARAASSAAALAAYVVEKMTGEPYYVLGPGTTIKAIGDRLGIAKTLLGVDVVHGKELIARDLNEEQLLELVNGKPARIVVTVIGGQGYIFGRGNQQISPRIIRTIGLENIMVVATRDKLIALNRPLLVDTGDAELDQQLSGFRRVITAYGEESVWPVEA